MQFYMGNPITLGKFHPKNKNLREPVAQEGPPPTYQPITARLSRAKYEFQKTQIFRKKTIGT
jgi:hypothetical protein